MTTVTQKLLLKYLKQVIGVLTVDFSTPVTACSTSLIACSLHFINSVGHSVSEEKNAAKKPAQALLKELSSFTLCTPIKKKKENLIGLKVIHISNFTRDR